jgi:hypothetical protein
MSTIPSTSTTGDSALPSSTQSANPTARHLRPENVSKFSIAPDQALTAGEEYWKGELQKIEEKKKGLREYIKHLKVEYRALVSECISLKPIESPFDFPRFYIYLEVEILSGLATFRLLPEKAQRLC